MRRSLALLMLVSLLGCDSESWSPTAPGDAPKSTVSTATRQRSRPVRLPLPPPVVLQPPCSYPKPLVGQWDPRAGYVYIVTLQDGTTGVAAAPYYEKKYGFKVLSAWKIIPAFAASLSPEVVAALRCEYEVRWIAYDSVGSFSATESEDGPRVE